MSDAENDTPAEASEPAVTVERWTYGGLRLDEKAKKFGVWVTPDGSTTYFSYEAKHILGCVYEVQARREESGKLIGWRGDPEFVRRSEDRDLIVRLAAEDRADRQHLEIVTQQRKEKKNNPLDEAIEQVAAVIRQVPFAKRPGLVGYVMWKLSRTLS